MSLNTIDLTSLSLEFVHYSWTFIVWPESLVNMSGVYSPSLEYLNNVETQVWLPQNKYSLAIKGMSNFLVQ